MNISHILGPKASSYFNGIQIHTPSKKDYDPRTPMRRWGHFVCSIIPYLIDLAYSADFVPA